MLCCFLTMAFVYFYCPEVSYFSRNLLYIQKLNGDQTTGKTLEEIDYIFARPEVRERLKREGAAPDLVQGVVQDEEKASISHTS